MALTHRTITFVAIAAVALIPALALADLMLEAAPLADEALARITAAAIEGRAGTAALVWALADRQL